MMHQPLEVTCRYTVSMLQQLHPRYWGAPLQRKRPHSAATRVRPDTFCHCAAAVDENALLLSAEPGHVTPLLPLLRGHMLNTHPATCAEEQARLAAIAAARAAAAHVTPAQRDRAITEAAASVRLSLLHMRMGCMLDAISCCHVKIASKVVPLLLTCALRRRMRRVGMAGARQGVCLLRQSQLWQRRRAGRARRARCGRRPHTLPPTGPGSPQGEGLSCSYPEEASFGSMLHC